LPDDLTLNSSLLIRNNWRLYVHVHKTHRVYKKVHTSGEDGSYACPVPKIRAHMHGGVTLKEICDNDAIIVGCDFSHWGDGPVVGCIPPEDESCLVHMYAQSLESVMLELDKKAPSLGPEDWVRFTTLSDYSRELRKIYVAKLKRQAV
jgi:hypothetical protein